MKNNRELERLGIKTLVPIVNNTSVKRKGEDHEVSHLFISITVIQAALNSLHINCTVGAA
jgi:hypothetical protein